VRGWLHDYQRVPRLESKFANSSSGTWHRSIGNWSVIQQIANCEPIEFCRLNSLLAHGVTTRRDPSPVPRRLMTAPSPDTLSPRERAVDPPRCRRFNGELLTSYAKKTRASFAANECLADEAWSFKGKSER